jgi:hypothetical protein
MNMKGGKVGNRGITKMFGGYSSTRAKNCHRMYNPVTSQVSETRDIIWLGRMYFTSENCKKTKMLPVIVVPITNNVSNEDMTDTEVIKVIFLLLSDKKTGSWTLRHMRHPNLQTRRDGKSSQPSMKKSIPTGRYNPSSGKTVVWNVTATDVDQDIEKESQAGHYNIFDVVYQDEITLTWVHHNMCFKVANDGAGMGGDIINMQEL